MKLIHNKKTPIFVEPTLCIDHLFIGYQCPFCLIDELLSEIEELKKEKEERG